MFKKITYLFIVCLAFILTGQAAALSGDMVIANRGSGTISVIDVASSQLKGTHDLPATPSQNTPEPMYVAYAHRSRLVFVGDRANNQVAVFNANNYHAMATVPAGNGVFHMWAKGKQLWVVNDIDKTLTVINTQDCTVMNTVAIPQDLAALGGKPHDVILDHGAAYVSIVGASDGAGYIVKYSRRTFNEVARAKVGADPHLILNGRYKPLYVASQNGNAVHFLKRSNLREIKKLDVTGAHGVTISRRLNTLYATNLPGGGTNGIHAIDLKANRIIGSVDTAYAVPHNLSLNFNRMNRLYLTHSGGGSDKVTIYKISKQNRLPEFLGEVTVGLNPFGLTFVP